MNKLLTQKLDTATHALKQAAADRFTNNTVSIKKAIEAIYQACLLNQPDDEAEWQDFARNTATDVKACLYNISGYVTLQSVDFDIQWISDDWQSWRQLCRLLSELTFLSDIYRRYISEERLEILGCDELEALLKSLSEAGDLPDEYIPDGIPDSHWWWWYPEQDASLAK